MEEKWNKIYQLFNEKMGKIEKANKELKEISVVAAVGYTIFFLFIKCFEYAFELGRIYVNHMDKSYISVNKEELLYQLIYTFAIFIVWGIVNYMYYFIGIMDNTKKRRKYKLEFYVVEAIIVFFIVIFIGNISIIELFKEIICFRNFEWLIIIIELIFLCIMINMFGIVFSYGNRKEKRRKSDKEIDSENQEETDKEIDSENQEETDKEIDSENQEETDKEIDSENQEKTDREIDSENQEKTDNEEKHKQKKQEVFINFLKTIVGIAIVMAIGIVLASVIGANFEQKKSNYKVLCVQCSKENKNAFFMDGKYVEIYPIIYEDKEEMVVSRLEKKDNTIFLNYNYQAYEKKSGKEVRYIVDIFDKNNW